MDIPKIALIHNRRKKEGKASIEVRITLNGKQKYISTGISVKNEEWKDGEIVAREDALVLNKELSKTVLEIREVIMQMYDEGNMDLMMIPQRLAKLHRGDVNFIQFIKERVEIRKYGKASDTQERYDRFLRLFKEWGRIREFEDVTDVNIILYDKYLKSKGMKPYSKWNNYHRFLNGFIIDAVCEGLLHRNPYKWINIDRGEKISREERYLTPAEFERLKLSKMPTKRLERARDVFVFQTYTCLSYSDLRSFKAEMIKEIGDMKVYIGKRRKTGKEFVIPLLKGALDVLDKYKGELPVISDVNYNLGLKAVADVCGIDKSISSHWARHTGATMLLNEGIELGIISKICGHSSVRITEQIYAKILNQTIINALKKLDK